MMKSLLRWALGLTVVMSFPLLAALDINTAKQSELESIRGVGPVKAKAIIDYRAAKGPFKTLEELDNVRGFGKASIEKLRTELVVVQSVPLRKQVIFIEASPRKNN